MWFVICVMVLYEDFKEGQYVQYHMAQNIGFAAAVNSGKLCADYLTDHISLLLDW